ncbi:MAG TPA: phosphoribosyltransferase family protein [Thermoanaerobaculia bacterium]|nr:phosphoribosyltransferase family protein [Thermoanaerobaculia bacterium]
MTDPLLAALPARRGHFRLESGLHTDCWLTLDAMLVDPQRVAPLIAALGDRLVRHAPTAVCGPLLGGAFLAQAIALRLGLRFFYAEPRPDAAEGELFRARYGLTPAQAWLARGERVAVVDDAISAGSSVRATVAALADAGATVPVVATFLLLGDLAAPHFAALTIPIEALERRGLGLWKPTECPLCSRGTPLEQTPL